MQVGANEALVDPDRGARTRHTQMAMLFAFACIVIHDGVVRGDLRPHDLLDLRLRGRAMQPGCDQDGNVLPRNAAGFQPFE